MNINNYNKEVHDLRYCTTCGLARMGYGKFCVACGSETDFAHLRLVHEGRIAIWKVTNLLLDISIRGVAMACFFALPSVATCLMVVVANILCATAYYKSGDPTLKETEMLRYLGTTFFMAALAVTFVLFFLIIAQMSGVPEKRRATFEPGTWSWFVSIGVVVGVELVLFGNVHAQFRGIDEQRKKKE
jgi:hypothetical protein